MKVTRRGFATGAGATLLAGWANFDARKRRPPFVESTSAAVILKASSYEDDLAAHILTGVRAFDFDVRGKRVLIKPQLAAFAPECANTHPALIAAACEVFRSLGAAEIQIGDGPEYHHDARALAEAARYGSEIPHFDKMFVDLNHDDVTAFQGFPNLGEIYLPNTALQADLIVSMPKMKTHMAAGVSLSMHNYFGLAPGAVYGWPKHELHRLGNSKGAVELTGVFRRGFAIVDGIIGMEGNGPLEGTPRQSGVLVMGTDLVAVDATCCRAMDVDPLRIPHLDFAADRQGVAAEERIEQRGEGVASVRSPYQLTERFQHLRLSA